MDDERSAVRTVQGAEDRPLAWGAEDVPGMMPLLCHAWPLSSATGPRAERFAGSAPLRGKHLRRLPRLCVRVALAALLLVSLVPFAGLAISDATLAQAGDATDAAATAAATAEGDAATTAEGAATTAVVAAEGDAAASSSTASSSTEGAPADPAAGSASVVEKDEVVYALLSEDGAPRSGYVINHFLIDGAGTLADEGAYSTASNLSTIAPLALKGRDVSVAVEEGDFYYEGVLSTVTLPWLVSVSYTLDGAPVEPERLAGASGLLGIHIETRQNREADPVFFENYLLQVQLTLDTGTIRDLKAPDATIATAGTNRQVAFMVMPGKEGDLSLTARVTDFEMPGIQVSGLPFSMVFEVPDTTGMVDDMATLTDAIGALDEGVGELQSGVASMKVGAADLASGSADLNEGLALLSGTSTKLTSASAQVDAALAEIARQLEGGAIDPAQITQLVAGLRQLAAGLSGGDPAQPGLAEGLAQTRDGIASATATMDSYIAGIVPVDATAIGGLYADPLYGSLQPDSQATIGALVNTNTQAAYVRGAWYGPNGTDGVKAGLESAAAGLDQSIGSCQYMAGQLNTIADGLEAGLSGLAGLGVLTSSMKELSGNYSSFNEGLAAYAGGVDAIASNYRAFNSGLAQFASGVGSLYGGISDLRDGTNELYVNVEDLPQTIQEEIDGFLADYQKSDFKPVSFTAPGNEHVERVQFVLMTDPIEIPAPEEEAPEASVEESLWDRLKALFE